MQQIETKQEKGRKLLTFSQHFTYDKKIYILNSPPPPQNVKGIIGVACVYMFVYPSDCLSIHNTFLTAPYFLNSTTDSH